MNSAGKATSARVESPGDDGEGHVARAETHAGPCLWTESSGKAISVLDDRSWFSYRTGVPLGQAVRGWLVGNELFQRGKPFATPMSQSPEITYVVC